MEMVKIMTQRMQLLPWKKGRPKMIYVDEIDKGLRTRNGNVET